VFSDKIDELFYSQLQEWELAKVNYSQLEKVKTRKIDFGSFDVYIQFNPERIRSSAAKVDAKSISTRPCFLCEKNRPSVQRGVTFGKSLTILINPFPVFSRHLTIPSELHTDQRIINNFDTMLSLAEALPSYTVFYNGPQCGASAPDHLHFQAGSKGSIPMEKDFTDGRNVKLVSGKDRLEIWQWTGYRRGIITLAGHNRHMLVNAFNVFFNRFSETQPDKPEPMLNILAGFSASGWIIHIIPRKQHRPSQFFAEGSSQILLSPAAVDLGGVIITPREEDFIKITKADVEDIFSQVCLSEDEISYLINVLL
jgi:hypothetical protein